MDNLLDFARKLIPVVRAVGDIQRRYYNEGADVMSKADGSPVTLADQESEKLIIDALARLAPGVAVVGEESVAAGHIPDITSGEFFLVDALDGTKEFINGGGDFTVNIAYMKDARPVMGIIYAPMTDKLYFGAEGHAYEVIDGNAEHEITVRRVPEDGLTVVTSKRSDNLEKIRKLVDGKHVKELRSYSSSLKFCAVAAGEADFYPRLSPTCEWDTAAGDAILRAAGGSVLTLDGALLAYGKTSQKFLNPGFKAVSNQ